MRNIAIAFALVGCATNYDAHKPAHVQQVHDGWGQSKLVRNGVEYNADADGLWRAVSGNSRAEFEAAQYGKWNSYGFVTAMLGSGFVAGASYADSQHGIAARNSLASVGIGLAVGGIAMMFVARPHYREAIRIYNDSVDVHSPLCCNSLATRPVQPVW